MVGGLDRSGSVQPQHILDLGTGPAMLPKLRLRHPEANITGVEVQPEMLKQRKWLKSATVLIEADLAAPLSIPTASVGVITAVMVLRNCFIRQPSSETVRLLKPGGRMIVYDWVRRSKFVGNEQITPSLLDHFKTLLFRGRRLVLSR